MQVAICIVVFSIDGSRLLRWRRCPVLESSRYDSYETTSLNGESDVRFGSSPGTIVGTSMGVWYVGTVWTRGTCIGRDSGVVDNCVWTFVRAPNAKGFGAIGATGCAIGGVVVGDARGAFRR